MLLRYALLLTIMSCLTLETQARLTRSWSHEELAKASDAVALIEPLSEQEARDPYPGNLYAHAPADFLALNTTFKLHALLKGESPQRKEITVLHFTYSKKVEMLRNGARFAHFVPGPLQFKKQVLKDEKEVGGSTYYQAVPVWLSFLKKRPDGRYEPVTDPFDSQDSFREIHESSFYLPLGDP